jgi:FkbM family methyltransferase
MFDLSGISNKSLIGRLLRLPLKLIPGNKIMPVLQGPLKGKKWIVGSGTHGYWLGSYELEFQKKFSGYIKEGSVVYDLGANAGFYSLLASVLTGENGKVFAFEPVKANLDFLYKHIELNGINNIKVVPKAVADIDGVLKFGLGSSSFTGRIDAQGRTEVEAVKLDTFIRDNPKPDVIKIDIEGGESKALIGAKVLLRNYKPVIFLATHGRGVHTHSVQFLNYYGFETESLNEKPLKETDLIIAVKK